MVDFLTYSAARADRRFELVIFDLDGVLIDSELISASLILEMMRELGAEADFLFVRRNFIGKSFGTVIAIIEATFGLELPDDFEIRYLTRLATKFERDLKPTEGILTVLEEMTCKTCIATSSKPERAQKSLEITDLAKFFPNLVFTASMVARPKPAPDLFLYAAKTMNVGADRTLVVEDSVAGLKAALAAGMTTARYVGGGHIRGLAPVRTAPQGIDHTFEDWGDFRVHYPTVFQ